MYRYLFISALALVFNMQPVLAQQLEIRLGTSQADTVEGIGVYRHPLWDGVQAGLQVSYGRYRNRFIDARQVTLGNVFQIETPLMFRLADNGGLLRLDGFLNPGLRFMSAPEATPWKDYAFQPSLAATFAPGLLATLRVSDSLHLHFGAASPIVLQLSPSFVEEQYVTMQILTGASYALSDSLATYLRIPFGPTVGASGDTEKFVWAIQAGLRWQFDGNRAALLEPVW